MYGALLDVTVQLRPRMDGADESEAREEDGW